LGWRRGSLLIAAAILSAGCSPVSQATDEQGAQACTGRIRDGLWNAETCGLAIGVANAKLGWLHVPVNSIEYVAWMCPPNASCPVQLAQQDASVVFRFWLGDPVLVRVTQAADGSLIAADPEPPPDWLWEAPAP
jgi:hypothetical protein